MESVSQLVSNCANRGIPAQQFLNFYHEFINEKYGTSLNAGDEEREMESRKLVFETVSRELIGAFHSGDDAILLAEYMVHLLFINYDTYLSSALLPQVYSIQSDILLTHFHSLAASFIGRLEDKLIKEQMKEDLSTFIISSCLQCDMSLFNNQLFISIVKYLQALLTLFDDSIDINMDKESLKLAVTSLLTRTNKLNRILGKRIGREFETKLNLSLSSKLPTLNSPQIFSPSNGASRFAGTPGSSKPLDLTLSTSNPTFNKIQDLKLIRFYKNLWLNNKIYHFNTSDTQFLEKFSSINARLSSSLAEEQLVQDKITDLIETTYTSFAQLVNNKLYHQANTSFTLLERKYVHFITKRLPLIIKEYLPQSPSVIVNSLQNMDEKVKKAIKSYYSNKNDSPESNEDLFDDYSRNNFDIRHDFLKNLIMLNLRPLSVLNEFLREDQMVDVKTLKTDDSLIIVNAQGIEETVTDVYDTIKSLIADLDIENQYVTNNNNYRFSPDNPLLKLLVSFDSIAPTKQVEMSNIFLQIFQKAADSHDLKTLGKVLWILTTNIGHATTSMLCCISPAPFMSSVVKFLEKRQSDPSTSNSDEPDFDSLHSYVTYGLALSFVAFLRTTYEVDVEPFVQNFEESYTLRFLSSIEDIPEIFVLQNESVEESKLYLQNWLRDLFVNGSISDSQMRNTNVKDLINLIPFIFKQTVIAVQTGAVSNISNLSIGFEYFLQPFLMPGLIKIMFWLEYYLHSLKNNNPRPEVLSSCWEFINILICPPSLDDDAKGLHFIILKLNCVKLLNVLYLFRNDESNSSQYGVYAAHESIDPKLEAIIANLEYIASISHIYDVDTKLYETTKEGYSHGTLFSSKIPILDDFPIDKIMTNQLNSFWNLHSSTYYNYDYLLELMKITTPAKFLIDSIRTLTYKIAAYGIPGIQGKLNTSAIEQVATFFAYFMILHDVHTEEERIALLNYIESGVIVLKEVDLKQEPETKLEDDFDMLFGEPLNNTLDETSLVFSQNDQPKVYSSTSFPALRDTFGIVIAGIKRRYEKSRADGLLTEEEYENATTFTRKYVENLKNSVV
ncbi:unnamed protein product [Kluyveromyces dobzhanskii CBS 2104]|uniref:Mediator of RNA polymerase II transcription subunit 5 n=1 Tax=Kluyveromyces dobzhanskii CBS 2104 TaxID=1427455 RepID=A0A0A8L8Z9_9SACH|nr:unnamed protein product [Kluyveromyces dobzhanskii CBS 2104]